jgi:quinol monooxygenase YgiN
MNVRRREFLAAGAFAIIANRSWTRESGGEMFGLIGKMTTSPGKRDEFIALLVDGTASMPGCLSYIVAKDITDENALWITEVWDSKESHEASLSLPAVKAAIAKGRPLITGFGDRVVTTPVGGVGLAAAKR